MVSLSTSNDSSTATREPFGHAVGCSERPARTSLTTEVTLSMDHFHPGLAEVTGTGCACAWSTAGQQASSRARVSRRMVGGG